MSLDPCPSSPNCVSTQADPTDTTHRAEPVTVTGDAATIISAIKKVVTTAGGEVVDTQANGVDAVFTSKIFKFKDDVRFELDDDGTTLHYRSASRKGHSDLGVNRKRMNKLVPEIVSQVG